jgi:protein phosphatase
MGGHAVGEKASAKAVRDIPFIYQKHARDGVLLALRRAFTETNSGIYAIGQENPEFRGMGTTSTALVLRPEGAWVGHVGDSRAYRIRAEQAEQLTFDHSWVWEIARRQGLDPDEMGECRRNVIIRSLGPDPEVEVDIEGPHPLVPGDIFLLCSDGLTGVVTPQEIGAVVSTMALDDAARLLVHLANLRGGPDNITVLLVRVPGGPATNEYGKLQGPSLLRRAVARWNRSVPWPYTILGIGTSLAMLSLLMRQNEISGSVFLFLLSAVAILVGIVGLIRQLKTEPTNDQTQLYDKPRPLNVYKRHDCTISPALAEKFIQLETTLVEGMKKQGVQVDWDAHAKLAAGAENAKNKLDSTAAFRARCASLLFLAEAFHKSRHKQESFRPNWDSPASR